jgi:hypothetical protein
MTLLSFEIRAFLLDRIVAMMREASVRAEDPTIGPPCARFYLRQRQDVSLPPLALLHGPNDGMDMGLAEYEQAAEIEILRHKARFDVAKVVSVWEVSIEQSRELDPGEHERARHGSIRVELYEHAIVDFWTEASAGVVHVDWVFGPSHGIGQTSRIQHRNGGVVLEEIGIRWRS